MTIRLALAAATLCAFAFAPVGIAQEESHRADKKEHDAPSYLYTYVGSEGSILTFAPTSPKMEAVNAIVGKKTVITINGKKAAVADLKKGEQVRISMARNDEGQDVVTVIRVER
ncbi:MAG: hypothetical protein H0W72_11420 [Planctomycetes bacterium]|nr:hypothetical protein [Planctomycetota bacterium]